MVRTRKFTGAAFLIAKPFQPATVSAVISQALFFERKAHIAPKRASAG